MDKMDRKIKYALQMGDGVNVRTLEDLRQHFDFNEVTGYYVVIFVVNLRAKLRIFR